MHLCPTELFYSNFNVHFYSYFICFSRFTTLCSAYVITVIGS